MDERHENLRLGERSLPRKEVQLNSDEMPARGKATEIGSRLLVAGGGGMGTGSVCSEALFGLMKMSWNSTVVTVAQPCENTKKHLIVHLKMVHFMA